MSKLTKNQKAAVEKLDKAKLYDLPEACGLLKEINYVFKLLFFMET